MASGTLSLKQVCFHVRNGDFFELEGGRERGRKGGREWGSHPRIRREVAEEHGARRNRLV